MCDKAPTRLVAGAEDSDMPLLSFAHFGPPLQYGWMAQNPSVLNHPSPAPLARSSPFERTTRPTRLSDLENEAVGRFRCTSLSRVVHLSSAIAHHLEISGPRSTPSEEMR